MNMAVFKQKAFLFIICTVIFFFLTAVWCGTVAAQNVAINSNGAAADASSILDVNSSSKGMLIPRVSLSSAIDATTIASPAVSLLVYNTATAGTSPNNIVPGYYYWNGTKWIALGSQSSSGLITFSTGNILSGATVVSAAPILIGFGNSNVEVINGSGESTFPPQAAGFSFPVPFSGTIQNLQVSADLLVASASVINVLGLQYDFTVFVAHAVPNNGIGQLASPYITTPLVTSVRFGFPNTIVTPGNFYTATNINSGSITVNAGDRIGIRVRTLGSTDPSASDITQLAFSASLSYSPQ
jgi:hypothetical protein